MGTMMRVVTWFVPTVPSPDVCDVLDCRYVAASAGHHDLLPDGCMDLVWTAAMGIVVCGPDTHGWSFDMPIGREMAGVRFRPGAAAAVFGVPANELVDRRVPLADLLGGRTARVLTERLGEAADGDGRMAALEDLVRAHRDDVDPTVELASLLAHDPGTSVDALGDHAGVSARQLRRRFDRAVGYGPAFYGRIARLQRFAAGAVRRPDLGLAELAAAAGYADQPHLAKDARAIAGRTPRELIGVLDRSSLAVGVRTDGRSVQDAARAGGARWAA
jgi:AraC-like DNA-binding protein